MATTVKEILLKFGIDNSNWKSAIQQLGNMLAEQQQKTAKAQTDLQKQIDTQKAAVKAVVETKKQETAELQKQVTLQRLAVATSAADKAAAAAKLAQDRLASAELQKQVLQQKILQEAQKTITAQTQARIQQERLITAEIARQTASLRQQATAQRLSGGGGGGRRAGEGGGFLSGLVGGFGSRLAGTIGFAVLSAEGLGRILEELTIKMKNFIESTGPLSQVQQQFQKLATTAGIDPTKFIGDLRTATKGLVEDTELYRNANIFLQSGIKASQKDIVQLTQATVGLARAQGKDATSAIESLNRFFLTGYARTLAWETGIQRGQLQLAGLSRNMDQAGRSTMAFQQALQVITRQYQAIGEPALTFTERLTQADKAQHRFWEELSLSFQKSTGFQVILDFIDRITEKWNAWTESASDLGDKFGTVFGSLAEVFTSLVKSVTLIGEQVGAVVMGVFELAGALFGLAAGQSAASQKMSEFSRAMYGVTLVLFTLSDGIETIVSGLMLLFRVIVTGLAQVGAAAMGILSLMTPHGIMHPVETLKETYRAIKEEGQKFQDWVTTSNASLEADLERHTSILKNWNTGGQNLGKYRLAYSAPSEQQTAVERVEEEVKFAKYKEQLTISQSKAELEQTQEKIKAEEALQQAFYDQGLLSFASFLEAKGKLQDQDHEARMKQIKEEFTAKEAYDRKESELAVAAAKLKQVQTELQYQQSKQALNQQMVDNFAALQKDPTKTAQQRVDAMLAMGEQFATIGKLIDESHSAGLEVARQELALANEKLTVDKAEQNLATGKEEARNLGEQQARKKQQLDDEVAARRKNVETIQQMTKASLDSQQEDLEHSFKQGEISAEDYLQQRVGLIFAQQKAAEAAAAQELKDAKNSEAGQAEYAQKKAAAAIEVERQLTKIVEDELDIRTKAYEEAAERAKKVLDEQLQYQQKLAAFEGPVASQREQVTTLQTLIKLEEQRLDTQKQQLETVAMTDEQWAQQLERIQQSQTALLQYQEQLIKARGNLTQMNDAAENFASAFESVSGLFLGRTQTALQQISKAFTDAAKRAETMEKLREQIAQRQLAKSGQAPKISQLTPEQIFQKLYDASESGGTAFKQALEAARAEIQEQEKALNSSTSNLSSSIDTVTSALKNLADQIGSAADQMTGGPGKKFVGPQIPKMAGGGIVDSPTVALIGEAGPEAVVPLSGMGGGLNTGLVNSVAMALARFDAMLSGTAPTAINRFVEALMDAVNKMMVGGAHSARGGTGVPVSGLPSATQPSGNLTPSDVAAAKALASGGTGAAGTGMAVTSMTVGAMSVAAQPIAPAPKPSVGTGSFFGLFGKGGALSDIFTGAKGAVTSTGDTQKADISKINGDLHDFALGINAATQSVSAFISGLQGQGGPAGAGLSGAQGGSGLGGGIGGLFSGISAAAGPIGAVIGGIVGGIIGIFAGKAEEEAEKVAREITASFQATVTEVSAGTQTLAAGVQLVDEQIQEAVTTLGSQGKKGQKQLQNILPNMESQLSQLQEQQAQVLKGFDSQLETLNTPQVFQDMIGQVQSIISTYTQYIQAGGQVANANEYLQDSFQNLVINGLQQLNQAEQGAVQNALNYNDLLLQQQEATLNYNEQVQQIMGQGVATRQAPAAIQKGIQLQELQQQYTIQQDQMNEQIQVSAYQLKVQQQIFGLATTRIGLETQLVHLQNAQTDYQQSQNIALQDVVGNLQQQLPTSSAAALQEFGLGSAYVAPEPGEMPIPPVPTGIPQIDQQNQEQYQQALAYYQEQQTLPISYINPQGTAAATSTTGNASQLGGQPGATVPTTTTTPVEFGSLSTNLPYGNTGTTSGYTGTTGGATSSQSAGTQPIAFIQDTDGTIIPVYASTQTLSGATMPSGYPAPSGYGLTSAGAAPPTGSTSHTAGGNYVLAVPPLLGITGPTGVSGTPIVSVGGGSSTLGNNTGLLSQILTAPVATAEGDLGGRGGLVGLASGGTITSEGLAYVHTGETVVPAGANSSIPSGALAFLQGWQQFANQASGNLPAPPTSSTASATNMQVESTINDMVNSRNQAEMQVVNAKMLEIQADMQRLGAWKDFIGKLQANGGTNSSSSIEQLLHQLYNQRGAAGFGGFSGEIG